MDVWQFKVRLLRKKLRGWAKNVDADIRKEKQVLRERYDLLDKKNMRMAPSLGWKRRKWKEPWIS